MHLGRIRLRARTPCISLFFKRKSAAVAAWHPVSV